MMSVDPAPAKLHTLFTKIPAGPDNKLEAIVPSKDIHLDMFLKQVPKEYFRRSAWRSSYYVARDIAQSVAAALIMYTLGYSAIAAVDGLMAGQEGLVAWLLIGGVRLLIWGTFWFVQGVNWTALWVMAHECGHQAYSDYRIINDSVGFLLHSFLLVPYHSWRISHGNHHKHTNHLTKDTVFVPATVKEAFDESPMGSLWGIFLMLTFGWPGYLAANLSGQKYERRANHFEPASPLFRPSEAADVLVSDVGLVVMLAFLGFGVYTWGLSNMLVWYFVPYLHVNAWLVLITYLQHSDVRLLHYTPAEWTFVRGALSTIDRSFGPLLNWWLHHINDSHVVHHLYSQMPFYNAIEVTRKYARDIFGEMYQCTDRSVLGTLWESWRACRYVDTRDGVMIFRK